MANLVSAVSPYKYIVANGIKDPRVNDAIRSIVKILQDTHKELAGGINSLDASVALKAPIASPALTGVPIAPTAAPLNNSTQLATTAYADAASAVVHAYVDSLLAAEQALEHFITLDTVQATTSGTSKTFSPPSWAKCIMISIMGVSTNGTSGLRLRLGTGGAATTSGYLGALGTELGGAVGSINFTAGFDLNDSGSAASIRHGLFTLNLGDASTNTWLCTANIGQSDNARSQQLGGSVSLAGALDTIVVTTTNGTDTFDLGKVSATYI